MNRRTFLGVLTSAFGVALVPLPDFELPVRPLAVPGRIGICDITLMAEETGIYTVRRSSAEAMLLQFPIGAGGAVQWAAAPGCEIVCMEGDPLVIEGPSSVRWTMTDGHTAWHSDGREIQMDARLGARARRRQNASA